MNLTRCDISDDDAVKQRARDVASQTGGGLDLLINNAGFLTPGPLEVLSLDAIRREFDVNVFGSLSVINSFLAALRHALGCIVQISTWTAHMPMPFNGPSGASKAAVEVLAAVYRAELKRFGIDVVVVVPGNMRTGGPAKTAAALQRVADAMTAEQRELYGQTFGCVDIYKMDADGKAVEHWDTLQVVGDPKNSAPWLAPNVPRANSHGMF